MGDAPRGARRRYWEGAPKRPSPALPNFTLPQLIEVSDISIGIAGPGSMPIP